MGIGRIVLILLLILALIFSSGCMQGIRNPNPELCEKVSQQRNRDVCYHRVALEKNDEILCSKIADLNERDSCYMDLASGRTRYFIDD